MSKILGVMLTVSDIQKMGAFFTDVLAFEMVGTSQINSNTCENLFGLPGATAQLATLRLGREYLYLIAFDPSGKPYPQTRSNDHLFQHIAIVVSDLEKAHQLLNRHGITAISEGPITIPEWNEPAAGIQAFYFQSPEGHPLELIYFPPKKGRKIWQQKERLFLGVDHTAIAIFHTEKSLHFYQDTMGMKIIGESLNHGSTQEELTGVPGAEVKITGLGFEESKGMGLEFLHYLKPSNGLPTPDLKSNDLGCTYTVIEVDDLHNWKNLEVSRGSFSSHDPKAFSSAMLAIDPDKHRLLFVAKTDHLPM